VAAATVPWCNPPMHPSSAAAVVAVLLCSLAAGEALPATLVQGLPGEEPRAILASPAGGFVLVYPDQVRRWRDGDGTIVFTAAERHLRVTSLHATVGQDGTVTAMLAGSTDGVGRTLLVRCLDGCRWETVFTATETSSLRPVAAATDRAGVAHFIALHEETVKEKDEEKTIVTERWYDGSGRYVEAAKAGMAPERLLYDAQGRPVVLYNSLDELVVERVEPTLTRSRLAVVKPQMYRFDAALGPDGRLQVLYHDPAAEALRLASVDLETREVMDVVLEGKESGIECALLGTGADGEAAGLAYFYRNAFYKGLKALRGRGAEWSAVDVDASSERNLGWELHAARATDGSILVSYLDDVLDKRRVTRHYASLEELWNEARPEPTGWEARPELVSLVAGGGFTYARWGLWSSDPGAQNGHGSWDVTYELASTRVGRAFLEGEVGHLKLGASYLHSLVGDELSTQAGTSAKRAFDLVTAVVGWDQLFLYQDVQVRLEWGSLRGLAHAVGPTTEDVVFTSPRRRVEVDLLSAFRIKLALAYEYFRGPFGAYVYGVRSGEKTYALVGSAFDQATFHDFSVSLGYSLLDYTAKYETNVSRPFIDVQVGLGRSLISLDHEIVTDAPFEARQHTFPMFLTGDVEVGWLVQRRSYALHGLGFFGRAGVRAHGLWYPGGADKPSDRDKAATTDDTELLVSRAQGFFGPYFDLGVVF
jgi:hypothetical protein